MVDLTTLTRNLYYPLLRYHQRDGNDLSDVKKALDDAIVLGRQLQDRPNIMEFMNSLSGLNVDTTRLSDAIITKWKADPQFLNKLERDLLGDREAAARLVNAIKNNPNNVASLLNDMAQYNAGSLSTLAPVAAVNPAVASPAPQQNQPRQAGTSTANPSTTRTSTGQPARSAPAAGVAATPVTASPPTVAQPATTGTVPTTVSAPPQPTTPEELVIGQQIARGVFESLADASDAQITQALTKDMVKNILTSMSRDAITKFGVSAQDANAFASTISDPNNDALLDRITRNFKNNPDFIRQLAKASKDSGEPLSDTKKNAARAMMTPIMENPEKLAEDAYVKGLTRNLKMGNSNSPMMSMLSGMFGGMGGWLGQLMDGFRRLFSGFFGGASVFSVVNTGGSMLPTIMVNRSAIEENRARAEADRSANPRDMTALSLNGQRFITVKEKDASGREIERQVPNTIEITTTDGKKVKAVPAVGVLLAQQARGNFDPDTGRWIAGPVHAWIVTGLNEDGGSSAVRRVTMSEAEFLRFKKQVDETSAKYGDGRPLAFENYTEQDARRAGIVARIPVTIVNPQTGAVTNTVLRPATPVSPDVRTFPVPPQPPIEERALEPTSS